MTELSFTGTPSTATETKKANHLYDFDHIDGTKDVFSNPQAIMNTKREILNAAKKAGIKLPEEFNQPVFATANTAGAAVIEDYPEAKVDHMANAANAYLAGENPAEHLMKKAIWDLRLGLSEKIYLQQRSNMTTVINAHADSITAQVREEVFEPALQTLTTLYEAEPDAEWNLDTVISKKEFARAAYLTEQHPHVEAIHAAYALRAALYNTDAFTTDAAWVKEPTEFGIGQIQTNKLEWIMRQIKNGRTLHYPTATEWKTLSDEHAAERAKQEAKDKASEPKVSKIKAVTGGNVHKHNGNMRDL